MIWLTGHLLLVQAEVGLVLETLLGKGLRIVLEIIRILPLFLNMIELRWAERVITTYARCSLLLIILLRASFLSNLLGLLKSLKGLMVYRHSLFAVYPFALEDMSAFVSHNSFHWSLINKCYKAESPRLLSVFVLHDNAIIDLTISWKECSELVLAKVMGYPTHKNLPSRWLEVFTLNIFKRWIVLRCVINLIKTIGRNQYISFVLSITGSLFALLRVLHLETL